jgi:general secretion pathway protein A
MKQLQELLKGAGYLPGSASGVFDRPTEEGLRAFQRAEGLAPNGKAGERTLLHLYRRAGGFFPPGIARDAGPGEGPRPLTSKEQKG